VPTKTTLSLPLLSWIGERKYDERLEGQGQGKITHQLLSWTKQTELGEKREFNSSPIKSEYGSDKQNQISKHLPPYPSLLPRLSFTPVSLPPPPEWRRGMGNGGYGQFITRCLCRSFFLWGRTPHTLPLLQ